MMEYFPRGDKHYLKDNINHLVVRKELFKRFKSKGWTTRTTDDAEWISTDEGSQADETTRIYVSPHILLKSLHMLLMPSHSRHGRQGLSSNQNQIRWRL